MGKMMKRAAAVLLALVLVIGAGAAAYADTVQTVELKLEVPDVNTRIDALKIETGSTAYTVRGAVHIWKTDDEDMNVLDGAEKFEKNVEYTASFTVVPTSGNSFSGGLSLLINKKSADFELLTGGMGIGVQFNFTCNDPAVKLEGSGAQLMVSCSGYPDEDTVTLSYYRNTIESYNGASCLESDVSVSNKRNTYFVNFNGLNAEKYYFYCVMVRNGVSYTSNMICLSNPGYVPPTPTPTPSTSVPPRITKDPTDETVTEGDSATFIARAENATEVIWYLVNVDGRTTYDCSDVGRSYPGLEVEGQKGETLVLGNLPYEMNGWSVYAEFSGPGGKTETKKAKIEVKKAELKSAVINTQPMSTELENGQSTTLTVAAVSPDHNRLKYQWYRNTVNSNEGGEAIPGAVTESYTPAYSAGTVYYYVAVWNVREDSTSAVTLSAPAAVSYPAAEPIPVTPTAAPTPAVPEPDTEAQTEREPEKEEKNGSNALITVVCIIGVVALLCAVGTIIYLRKMPAVPEDEPEESGNEGKR